jgi:hypothetical protein
MTLRRTPPTFCLLPSLALLAGAAEPGSAQQPRVVTAACTTRATTADGRQRSCRSERQTIRAPEDHVFVQNSLQGGFTRRNGSTNNCFHGWDDFVEVVPGSGITQPKTFWLQAHARSPRGSFAGPGWTACRFTLDLSRYGQ